MELIPPHGHCLGEIIFTIDVIGLTYMLVAIVLNLVIFGGLFFLWHKRHDTYVRMIRLELMTLSFTMMSIYATLAFLGYSFQALYPCSVEFHVMASFFPVGQFIADVVQVKLLHTMMNQSKLLGDDPFNEKPVPLPKRTHKNIFGRGLQIMMIGWNESNETDRFNTILALTVKLSTMSSVVLFLISRRFHSWGLVGTQVNSAECRSGFEWSVYKPKSTIFKPN
jgi:hypothetical protein